jgi:hypothetical protein
MPPIAGRHFPKQPANRPIAARTLNRPIAEVEKQSRRGVGPGLASIEVDGVQQVRPVRRRSLEARLIAYSSISPGGYTWQGIYGTGGGSFADLPSNISDNSGTDKAFEINGNTTLPAGTRVQLIRDWASGAWLFQYDTC